jgi:putative hemolysin
MSRSINTLMVMLLLTVACSSPAPPADEGEQQAAAPAWQEVRPAQMSPVQQAQQERGLAAQQAMGQQLKAALVAAIDEGGPEAAIAVCHEQAPIIAAAVAASEGIKIGRTSSKLRNQANQPPEWARDLIAQQHDEPIWLAGPEGRLAGLLPIRLQPECEICHGAPTAIAEELLARINESYPDDQATGFAAGDLRGWFWVEVGEPL